MSEILESLFSEIIGKYCEIRKIDKLPEVKLEITDDIYSECLLKSADSLKPDIESQREWLQGVNGTIIYPELRTDTFGVLISLSYIQECIAQENNNWIGTLCHELTHVLDYIYAMELSDDLSMVEFKYEPFYPMFGYWTEFNARKYGHYLLRYYTQGELMQSEEALKDLIKREIPSQIEYLASCFQDGANQHDAIYATMHFLGRVKVWKELFPKYFTNKVLHQILGSNDWMEKLFLYLDRNDTVERAIQTFEEMEDILKDYFV